MPKGQHSRATMNLVKVFVCSIDKAQTHHKIFRFTLHEIVPFSSSLFHLQCSHHFQSIPAFLFSPKTVSRQKKNASEFLLKRFFVQVGDYLFSRAVSSELSSAQVSLTSVFGMGPGGTSPSSTPTDLTEPVQHVCCTLSSVS